jgi:hypothetical protein
VDRSDNQGGGDACEYVDVLEVAVQQQDFDEGAGACAVIEGFANGGLERLVGGGETTGRSRPHQRRCPWECAGLALQDLEVVIQQKDLRTTIDRAFVPGDVAAAVDTTTVEAPSWTRTRRRMNRAGTA